MRTPKRVGNISWTTYWFPIMFEEKPPWYEAMTWAVITGPIDANLRLEHKEIWSTAERMEYSQKGWNTRTEEAKLNFMKGRGQEPLLDGQ